MSQSQQNPDNFADNNHAAEQPQAKSDIHFVWLDPDTSAEKLNNIFNYDMMYGDAIIHIWTDDREKILNSYNLPAEEFPPRVRIHTLKELENNTKPIISRELHTKLWAEINRELIRKENYEAASNIVRLMALYLYGGMYTDRDNKPLEKIDIPILLKSKCIGNSNNSFIMPGFMVEDSPDNKVYTANNHTLFSSKENPIILNILEDIVADKLNHKHRRNLIFQTPTGETIPLAVKNNKKQPCSAGDRMLKTLQKLVNEKIITTEDLKQILWAPAELEKMIALAPKLSWLSADENQVNFKPQRQK